MDKINIDKLNELEKSGAIDSKAASDLRDLHKEGMSVKWSDAGKTYEYIDDAGGSYRGKTGKGTRKGLLRGINKKHRNISDAMSQLKAAGGFDTEEQLVRKPEVESEVVIPPVDLPVDDVDSEQAEKDAISARIAKIGEGIDTNPTLPTSLLPRISPGKEDGEVPEIAMQSEIKGAEMQNPLQGGWFENLMTGAMVGNNTGILPDIGRQVDDITNWFGGHIQDIFTPNSDTDYSELAAENFRSPSTIETARLLGADYPKYDKTLEEREFVDAYNNGIIDKNGEPNYVFDKDKGYFVHKKTGEMQHVGGDPFSQFGLLTPDVTGVSGKVASRLGNTKFTKYLEKIYSKIGGAKISSKLKQMGKTLDDLIPGIDLQKTKSLKGYDGTQLGLFDDIIGPNSSLIRKSDDVVEAISKVNPNQTSIPFTQVKATPGTVPGPNMLPQEGLKAFMRKIFGGADDAFKVTPKEGAQTVLPFKDGGKLILKAQGGGLFDPERRAARKAKKKIFKSDRMKNIMDTQGKGDNVARAYSEPTTLVPKAPVVHEGTVLNFDGPVPQSSMGIAATDPTLIGRPAGVEALPGMGGAVGVEELPVEEVDQHKKEKLNQKTEEGNGYIETGLGDFSKNQLVSAGIHELLTKTPKFENAQLQRLQKAPEMQGVVERGLSSGAMNKFEKDAANLEAAGDTTANALVNRQDDLARSIVGQDIRTEGNLANEQALLEQEKENRDVFNQNLVSKDTRDTQNVALENQQRASDVATRMSNQGAKDARQHALRDTVTGTLEDANYNKRVAEANTMTELDNMFEAEMTIAKQLPQETDADLAAYQKRIDYITEVHKNKRLELANKFGGVQLDKNIFQAPE